MKVVQYLFLFLPLFITSAHAVEIPNTALKINRLAERYEKARGVEQNYQKAFQLYCISAALGNSEANYNLGWMYFNGRGLKPSQTKAMGWFKRADKLGDQFAINMLKQLEGVRVEQDNSCPIPLSTQRISKKNITVWVKIIASAQEIDPSLVLAVIQTESAFNANALSTKNAQGLMQLIPKTARRFGVNNSWNPVENILGGVSYIRWLIRHFNGDVKLVLAAYNAGEDAVKRYNGIPPYNETQQYVRKIMDRYKKTEHPIPSV